MVVEFDERGNNLLEWIGRRGGSGNDHHNRDERSS